MSSNGLSGGRRGLGWLHVVQVVSGSAGLTLLCFLVLPLIQAITTPLSPDLMLQTVDSAQLPPPPPPLEDPEEEPEPEEPPPEMPDETPPLDLSQLELALNVGLGDGLSGGDFAVRLQSAFASGESMEGLFSLADLDQQPRAIHRPSPILDTNLRRKVPAEVNILFVVNADGLVENPIVQGSSDPDFERVALNAVRQWRFEPGKRNGQPVRFRMRVPIKFQK